MHTILNAAFPQYASSDNALIDMIVVLSIFPNDKIPFTASPTDLEEYGRELYKRAVAGEFGPVANYVVKTIPAAPNQPTTTGTQTL
jgi:hypothetical protein